MASFVFTVIGPDRPGLVDDLASVVAEHGGNWERSRMARLGGRFAGIVEVGLPDERAADLRSALRSLVGLEMVIEETDQAPHAHGRPDRHVQITVVGSDRPGLVRSVTAALVDVGANIEELTTSTTSAPMSGEPLFEANVTVALPASLDTSAVRGRLEALADRLMVDIVVSA